MRSSLRLRLKGGPEKDIQSSKSTVKRDTGDVAVIQDRDGIVLTEESEIRERWKEYSVNL